MPVGLGFQDSSGSATTDLANVKIVILEDGAGNKYTLDASSASLKLGYESNGGAKVEHEISGLASALGSLLNLADPSTPTQSVLATEVAKKTVVEAIIGSADFTNKVFTKAAPTDEVYTKTEAGNAFAAKSDLEPDSLKTKVAHADVVAELTKATDFTNKVFTKAAPTDEVYTKTEAGNAFATISHTHPAPSSGQLISPALQPAVAVDLSSLDENDPLPDYLINV